jgi:hypothetical protein
LDEDGIDYYYHNLSVMPSPGIVFAVNYLDAILATLGKYSSDECKDLRRQLKGMKLIKNEEYMGDGKDPELIAKIIKTFEMQPFLELGGIQGKHESNAWPTKLAYYLAHCIDGGLLCSQFTLQSLIRFLDRVTETKDEQIIKQELTFMLNMRKAGMRHERTHDPVTSMIKNLVSSIPGEYQFNERVLVVLIESGYL